MCLRIITCQFGSSFAFSHMVERQLLRRPPALRGQLFRALMSSLPNASRRVPISAPFAAGLPTQHPSSVDCLAERLARGLMYPAKPILPDVFSVWPSRRSHFLLLLFGCAPQLPSGPKYTLWRFITRLPVGGSISLHSQILWHSVDRRVLPRRGARRAFIQGAGSRQPEGKSDTSTPPDRDHGRGQCSSLPQG